MLLWCAYVVAPIVFGSAALALCALATLVRIGFLSLADFPPGSLMTILEGITDVPKLREQLQKISTSGSEIIDQKAIIERVQRKIFGQNALIEEVVKSIAQQFLRDKRTGPVAVYMIAGPSGTGKSLFGMTLGRAMYGPNGFVVFDMSTANSSSNANEVFGSPMGYQGGNQPSPKMAHLMQNPKTVVVIDEFEKTSKEVQNRFLSAWNDGWLPNVSTGKDISVRDAIFIITTNYAQDEIARIAKNATGNTSDISDQCKRILSQRFDTAVLSRVERVFAFKPLEGEAIAELVADKIIDYVESYSMTLAHIGFEVLVQYVIRLGMATIDGRHVDRMVREEYGERLSELKIKNVKTVSVSDKKGKLTIDPVK